MLCGEFYTEHLAAIADIMLSNIALVSTTKKKGTVNHASRGIQSGLLVNLAQAILSSTQVRDALPFLNLWQRRNNPMCVYNITRPSLKQS
jgi:hypothetical protein